MLQARTGTLICSTQTGKVLSEVVLAFRRESAQNKNFDAAPAKLNGSSQRSVVDE